MKLNSLNQNFSANIIKNETWHNLVSNAQEAHSRGMTRQTIEFLEAVEAIEKTEKERLYGHCDLLQL